MKLKTTRSLMNGCVIGILPASALLCAHPSVLTGLPLAVVFFGCLFLNFRYFHCPHCGEQLLHMRIPHFCPNCGHAIKEDERWPEQ